jgi:H+-translocating NAD(P) transhydrogenase subunit beta
VSFVINLAYIAASIFFIYGLKMMSRADTARRGNRVSAIGMLIAIVATLVSSGLSYGWIVAGLIVGSGIGLYMARTVQMTGMPEMVALLNGFGGLASFLVGWAEYLREPRMDTFTAVATFLTILVGGVTFTGSLVAFAKLSERISGKPYLFKNQHLINAGLLAAMLIIGIIFAVWPANAYVLLILAMLIALALGVLVVIPIGGADMPAVVSLLNSYSGIAASMAGFIIGNNVLIVSGSLVGASGIILTQIMCRAMNRSLTNVLFGGFGSTVTAGTAAVTGEMKAITTEEAYFVLEAASSVIVVPGYGMAVAQAQHVVRELGELLKDNGVEVRYAIHPVAGRMPGHMNVLLAEADVPYEQLVEPDDVNPSMESVDVAIVIGANDVVNPAAREDKGSPLYGMPIINVDQAKMVFVLKRGKGAGFSGVENPLFFKDNTRLIFGDAKSTLSALVSEFKEALAA